MDWQSWKLHSLDISASIRKLKDILPAIQRTIKNYTTRPGLGFVEGFLLKCRVLLLAGSLCLILVVTVFPSQNHNIAADEPTSFQGQIPFIASGFCGTYIDTFDDPQSGWFTGQAAGLNAEIIDGEYRLTFSGNGEVWLISGPMCKRSSYTATVDVRWLGATGNFIGLLFEIDDVKKQAYLFAVNTDDRVWLVFNVENNGLSVLIPATGHNAVLPGTAYNRLTAVRGNETIHLIINGTPVGELNGFDHAVPVVAGVAAASYTTQHAAEARFDNFIYNPPPAE